MAFILKRKIKAKIENETGLSTNGNLSGGRFFQNDGKPNMKVRGLKFWERLNMYHALLSLSNFGFVLLIFTVFTLINLIFAGIYLYIGIEHLNGLVATTTLDKFSEAFFFSAQTFTTVGYGRINPVGFAASFIASGEALIGLMSFALITGLIYGRFSRPRAYICYSKNVLFAPYKDGVALMLRMVPYTKNYLANVEAKVTLAMRVLEGEDIKTKFYSLDLEVSKANTLTANWTLVHAITEDSPLFEMKKEDLMNANVELLVFIHGFDESFANTVISRASYTVEDFVYGAKFNPMFYPDKNSTYTILQLDLLDSYSKVPIPMEFE